MKTDLIDLLQCPFCRSAFTLFQLEAHQLSSSVESGLLYCVNSHVFPISGSIPRIFVQALDNHLHELYLEKTQLPEKLSRAINATMTSKKNLAVPGHRHIQHSFSSEWNELAFNMNAWGQDVNEREKLFFQCMDTTSEELKGKLILDAGCGNGEVEEALMKFDAKIIGMDLSYSVDKIHKKLMSINPRYQDKISLVQGNVHQPPFKDAVFDMIHSAGVLHHTHDTRAGFEQLSCCLKKNGIFFIEVYSEDHKNIIEKIAFRVFNVIRKITTKLPHGVLHSLCWGLTPLLWLYIYSCNKIMNKNRYIRRNREQMELSLFDALSPLYDWHHTTIEVKNWFHAMGFIKIKKTFFNHNVIGINGHFK
ncbi:MAG: methyltransferase domain-containing protein [Bacteroidetes bacterium]|nr:MAG: methyltransferase domain-containing protein [Bacteroidota bacterium]